MSTATAFLMPAFIIALQARGLRPICFAQRYAARLDFSASLLMLSLLPYHVEVYHVGVDWDFSCSASSDES